MPNRFPEKFEVSVVIPVYNAEKYVSKAVESALQFTEVKEVLLIEDGSPDNALQVCLQLAKQHDRVKLLQHPDKGNHGAGASRNLGLINASCDYIAFLDADDYYLPNRFETDKDVFSQNANTDGVFNAIGVHYYSQGNKKRYQRFSNKSMLTTVNQSSNPDNLFPGLLSMINNYGYFSLDGLTIKRNILGKLDKLFNPSLRLHEDTEFIIRLSYYSRLMGGELLSPVALRGVHEHNRILINFKKRKDFYHTKYLLWDELFKWAKEANLPTAFVSHIEMMRNSRFVTTLCYRKAFMQYIKLILSNKKYLTKSCYYAHIYYYFFGRNIIARGLKKVKTSMQQKVQFQSQSNL